MIWALHGIFGAPTDWDELQVKGLNLRAVRLWERVRDVHSFAGELGAKVREEGDPAPSVMGYSMGGRLALHALIDEPALWKSGIIVSASPGLLTVEERKARSERDAEWAGRVRTEAMEDVLRDWDAQDVFGGAAKAYDRQHLEAHREAVARSFEAWSLGAQAPLWPRLAGVKCPVLWITGERDDKFTALAESATAGMPNARHEIMAGRGHRVPWEDPDGFARLVLRFQNEVAMGAEG